MLRKILIALAILLLGGITFFFVAGKWQKKQIAKLESKIEFLKEVSTPLQFMISSREGGQIRVGLAFLDADGKKIKSATYTLEGEEFYLAFYVVNVKDRRVAFPLKIFTEKIAPDDATSILDAYLVDGYPAIFRYEGMNGDLYEGLKELHQKIRQNRTDEIKSLFGSAVHDLKQIEQFEPGILYDVIVHTRGGIEIVESGSGL